MWITNVEGREENNMDEILASDREILYAKKCLYGLVTTFYYRMHLDSPKHYKLRLMRTGTGELIKPSLIDILQDISMALYL